MHAEAEKLAMTAKLLSQKQVLKKLNRDAESKQRHLTFFQSFNRPDHPISSKEMLLQLAKLTKKHSKADLRELRNGPVNEDSD
jgi:hypothetical protein